MPSVVDWNAAGLYFSALQKTAGHLFRLDPASGTIARVSAPDDLMGGALHDGRPTAVAWPSPRVADDDCRSCSCPTCNGVRAAGAHRHDRAGGGRSFVGIARADLVEEQGRRDDRRRPDQARRLRSRRRRYPLLCIIHGGPTGIDRPVLLAPIRATTRRTSGSAAARWCSR